MKLKVDNLPTQLDKYWVWKQAPAGYLGEGGWHAIAGPFEPKKEAEKEMKKLLALERGEKRLNESEDLEATERSEE